MIARNFEDKPEIDYIALVRSRLSNFRGIESMSVGTCDKIGAASADLRATDTMITIDHAKRRLVINTASPDQVERIATEAKKIWRTNRGPTLKDRRDRS